MNSKGLQSLPPGLFDGLLQLQSVNLGGNSLTSLPECLFCAHIFLTTLTLGWGGSYNGWSRNFLTSLPANLFPPAGSRLTSLYLSNQVGSGLRRLK